MCTYWLKLVGTKDKPFRESYERPNVDSRCRPRRIHYGDRLILYAVGSLRVFANVEVTSEVYEGDDNNWPWRLDIRYLDHLRIPDGVHLNEVSTSRRDLLRSIRQHAFIELDEKEYMNAVTKLQGR